MAQGLSCIRGMWDLPGPGLELVSPALADGFLTTAPPGKSPYLLTFDPISFIAKHAFPSVLMIASSSSSSQGWKPWSHLFVYMIKMHLSASSVLGTASIKKGKDVDLLLRNFTVENKCKQWQYRMPHGLIGVIGTMGVWRKACLE